MIEEILNDIPLWKVMLLEILDMGCFVSIWDVLAFSLTPSLR